jgi:Ca2+-binding RTX toxin-like protein
VGVRKSVLLLASVALGVLLAAGAALAADITCEPGSDFDNPCRGTPEDDTMRGTDGHDKMEGLAGIDTLYGGRFNDYLWGGRGNDTLRGEAGHDKLYGDRDPSGEPVTYRGNDRLIGGPRDDSLHGQEGNDRIMGGSGDDTIANWGGFTANYDRAHGETGNDFLGGGYGEKYGEGGNDYLSANEGNTVLFGGEGDDRLVPGTTRAKRDATDEGYAYEATGGPGEDEFGGSVVNPDLELPRDDITYLAVDGEHDIIYCADTKDETVRADPLDTFPENSLAGWNFGRQYCDSLTIVE